LATPSSSLVNAALPRQRLPLRALLPYALALEVGAAVVFEVIYASANAVTSLHEIRLPVAFAWESAMPLIPAWVLAYWSLWPLVLLAPFVLGTKEQMRHLAGLVVLETAAAAVVFILYPATLAYPAAESLGAWQDAYALTAKISMQHNLFPSLHVAFAVTCALVYSRATNAALAAAFGLWAGLIAASTLLLHLHHVADVVGGAVLAWVAVRYFRVPNPKRLASSPVKTFVPERRAS
jgi:membrane-associated phospholipid phosphatase